MVQTQHFDSQIVFLNIKLYPFLYPSSTPPTPKSYRLCQRCHDLSRASWSIRIVNWETQAEVHFS